MKFLKGFFLGISITLLFEYTNHKHSRLQEYHTILDIYFLSYLCMCLLCKLSSTQLFCICFILKGDTYPSDNCVNGNRKLDYI